MEIGTIETEELKEDEKRKKKGSSLRTSGGSSNGNGGGGDDGPDDNGGGQPEPRGRDAMPEETNPEKSRILTWFLLIVVLMTFGGLIGAYVVIATNGALEWRPFELPVQVWVSTVIILLSSITYHFGHKALDRDDTESAKRSFLLTTVLGAAFISSQILAWMALVERGLYMRGNPYAGFFYVLTAVHAVHVLGGIVALGYILLKTWKHKRVTDEQQKKNKVEAGVIGWYWHTMDGLWLVLLFLLGFWK
ncbi:MAG: heme-copper oxidase subunit III [Acidobacteria bacterium]|nr:MAG: heme-copper oxidase subunit III [Acidobacteriota bacterium]REK01355.1 MAG: heme-copper oxidase subunit III [Acidobacteriota bacterium]REK14311.1 MAG: heme-copper oxidase subunit III [Acidobacteriota bacterium]REK45026.1 MAG: heme-copper oxidase subunit III [Acidobacteriota bacterium]